MIAAVNGNIVYMTFTLVNALSDLRGHNSKCRGLEWLGSGNLLSSGQDGAVYLWMWKGVVLQNSFKKVRYLLM